MKLNLLWVRHAESISNIDIYKFNIHPFLSSKGLLQSIDFGEQISNLKINQVYCSTSLRTILTSLISISYYNLLNKNKITKIKIIPCISEKNTIVDYLNFYKNKYVKKIKKIIIEKYNYQNKIINPIDLYKISKESIDWLNLNIINMVLKNQIIILLKKNKLIGVDLLNKIKENNNEVELRKILIDTLLENNIENKEDILKLLNFKLNFDLLDFSYFLENNNKGYIDEKNSIYNFLVNDIFNENNNIILFSHKYFINYISDYKIILENCDFYGEIIEFDKNKLLKKKIIKTKLIKFKCNVKINKKYNINKNNYILENIQKKINDIVIKN
jgi:hypothetical protein